MKHLLRIYTVFLTLNGLACDGCNVYTPAGFNNSQHKIGIFARQRTTFGEFSQLGEMITKHSGHANDQSIWGAVVKEQYQTYELRGDFFIKERFQLTFVVPITRNSQFLNNVKRFTLSGLSDPTIMLGYNFVKEKITGLKQRLSFGGGVKFPLGLISLSADKLTPNLDFQPGTGAWNWIGYANYFITNSVWSSFVAVNYKANGFNKYLYQYGQTVNVKLDAFWQTKLGKNTLMLQVGTYMELADYDESIIKHKDTGGTILFGTIGIRYLTEKMILQGELQPVLNQFLNGGSQLLTKNRINLGLTYLL